MFLLKSLKAKTNWMQKERLSVLGQGPTPFTESKELLSEKLGSLIKNLQSISFPKCMILLHIKFRMTYFSFSMFSCFVKRIWCLLGSSKFSFAITVQQVNIHFSFPSHILPSCTPFHYPGVTEGLLLVSVPDWWHLCSSLQSSCSLAKNTPSRLLSRSLFGCVQE